MRFDVSIGRLVVDGFALTRAEQRALGAAVESNLAALVGAAGLDGALTGMGTLPALRTPGSVAVTAPVDPARLGAAIARSVFGAIGPGAIATRAARGRAGARAPTPEATPAASPPSPAVAPSLSPSRGRSG